MLYIRVKVDVSVVPTLWEIMKILLTNKSAFHDYEIIQKYEAGMVLLGSEVKSLVRNNANINEAFVIIKKQECYILNMHIAKYQDKNYLDHEPTRTRKLLLHKSEILKIWQKKQKESCTLIPLTVYLKNNKIKISFALAKKYKKFDKRNKKQTKADRRWITKY